MKINKESLLQIVKFLNHMEIFFSQNTETESSVATQICYRSSMVIKSFDGSPFQSFMTGGGNKNHSACCPPLPIRVGHRYDHPLYLFTCVSLHRVCSPISIFCRWVHLPTIMFAYLTFDMFNIIFMKYYKDSIKIPGEKNFFITFFTVKQITDHYLINTDIFSYHCLSWYTLTFLKIIVDIIKIDAPIAQV